MTTYNCKCPQCGAIVKSKGAKTFRCCGSSWNIKENLVGDPTREEKDLAEVDGKGDESGYTLPNRDRPPKIKKKEEDNMVCPFCAGDVYATMTKNIFYCHTCDRYLIEED
jgi:tRNA(Ile2) C34 agmatinyltransferase TiaS